MILRGHDAGETGRQRRRERGGEQQEMVGWVAWAMCAVKRRVRRSLGLADEPTAST